MVVRRGAAAIAIVRAHERRAWHPAVPGPGTEIRMDRDESHHLVRVLRLRAGDAVSVFDGEGREWGGVLVDPDPQAASVRVGDELDDRVEPPLAITLIQGLCRTERIEWVLQKGTEVGIAAFVVARARRSAVPDPGPAREARFRRIILEACKQSGRRRIPGLALTGAVPVEPPGVVLHTAPGVPPLTQLLRGPRAAALTLAVGPEGGFEDEEIARLAGAGWVLGGLGPRVLRTETAGTVAAALALAAWGDLGA